MSVLAVRKLAPRRGAEIARIEMPRLGPHDVLLEVKATSICGTDRHVYAWDAWAERRVKPPQTMGHECCGVVVDKGALVTNVDVGDLVSVETHIPCGHCRMCQTGNRHVCLKVVILGVDVDGCFAQQLRVPDVCCWKNPKGTDPRIAAIKEPFGNAVYTVDSARVSLKTVAIFGDGPIACFSAAICRAQGAARVVVVGITPARLELAKRMGAHRVIDARHEDPVETLLAETSREGFDVVLELAGTQVTVTQGFKVLRRRGTFIAFGIPSGPMSVDWNDGVIFKEAQVLGLNGRRMFETWYSTDALIHGGLVDPSPVITHSFPLEQVDRAFELLDDPAGTAGKIVLLPQP